MCSIVILRQPGATFPLILAGNRDEMAGRPWKAPARHWPDRPDLIGGIDELAGGSWLALNDTGVVAVVLNRMGTLGPEDGKRSRGELVLDALDYADAADAARAMVHLDPAAYRPFNLVVADNRDAFWLTLREGAKRIVAERIPDGLSMVTANDLNDDVERPHPVLPPAVRPCPGARSGKRRLARLGKAAGQQDLGRRRRAARRHVRGDADRIRHQQQHTAGPAQPPSVRK